MYGQQIKLAVELITARLADKEVRATEMLEMASDAGISSKTLQRAKHMINAQSKKKNDKWFWYMTGVYVADEVQTVKTAKTPTVQYAQLNLPIIRLAPQERPEDAVTETRQFDIASTNRIFLVCGASRFNGKFDAFAVRVPRALESNMIVGDAFVFCNWSRNQISILQWQGNGFAQYFKRADYGRFPWSYKKDVSAVEVTPEDLKTLLEYPRFMLRLSGC